MDAAILPLVAALTRDAAETSFATTKQAESAQLLAARDTEFHLSLSLDAWMPRLAGDFTDGPSPVDVDVVDLHEQELSFAGALTLTRDKLNVTLRGFSFATDGGEVASTPFTLGGVTVESGDSFDSEFSWWSAGCEVAYDFFEPLKSDSEIPAPNGTDFAVFALVSADIEGVSRVIRNTTTTAVSDANEAFAAIDGGIGFRVGFDCADRFPIVRRVEVSAEAAAGVTVPFSDGDYGSATRVEAAISAWFCHEGAVYFGYRIVGGSLDGDEVSFDGSVQGLRAGFTIAF